MHKVRRFFLSYRYYKFASGMTLLIFLLHAAILSLVVYFSGSDTISDRLSQSIPIEPAYQDTNYFSMANQKERVYSEKKELAYLKQMVACLDTLGADPCISYCNYHITASCYYLDRVYPYGIPKKFSNTLVSTSGQYIVEERDAVQSSPLSGICTKAFFSHNNIPLLEDAGEPLTASSAFVSDTTVVSEADGSYRKVRLGDKIEVYAGDPENQYHLHTCVVQGIYKHYSKFDYSYGRDATFVNPDGVLVSNLAMQEMIEKFASRTDQDDRQPLEVYLASIVFQVDSFQDYVDFRARMLTEAEKLDAWCGGAGDVPPSHLEIQEPRYLKLADSIQKTASLYRTIFLAVDAMLLILIGGLSWYLISRKKKEIFVFYSIGMKKRQIAAHYCGYYVLLAIPAAILGAMLGYFLNLLLSIKIARDTVALQEELLRFSNNGQQVARAIDSTVRSYDVGPAAILGGSGLTVAVTAAVTAGIVLLALAFILRKKPRDFVRGEGL